MTQPKKRKCLICGTPFLWADHPYRPFCSERCRSIDLTSWVDGSYLIPGRSLFDDENEPVHLDPDEQAIIPEPPPLGPQFIEHPLYPSSADMPEEPPPPWPVREQ